MSPLEAFAAAFGVIAVYLGARENILSWPTALVNVGLYAVVFFEARLYADMGLQVIYFVLSGYGWYQWKFGGARRTTLRVSRASARMWIALLAVNAIAWVALAAMLARHTNAVLPWLDSLLSTTSLCAQWLMTRKVLENWAIWIAVDLVYVPTFLSRGLYLTAALYAVFLVLAVVGWRTWKRGMTTEALVTA
ncbi:MAG: nicotinamide mononucleotide transporter [Gemmatimonadaceae bacterium]|nr:nicotinamide mononucleotide transporter [Gemmatimonadaceae bacterium]